MDALTFKKWLSDFELANGIGAIETGDLRAAWEAGQSAMRERCASVNIDMTGDAWKIREDIRALDIE